LAHPQHAIRPYAFAQDGGPARAAQVGAHFDLVAFADAELASARGVDDDAAMTPHVARQLIHERDAGIRAPRILHAARGERPEREFIAGRGMALGVALPDFRKFAVLR